MRVFHDFSRRLHGWCAVCHTVDQAVSVLAISCVVIIIVCTGVYVGVVTHRQCRRRAERSEKVCSRIGGHQRRSDRKLFVEFLFFRFFVFSFVFRNHTGCSKHVEPRNFHENRHKPPATRNSQHQPPTSLSAHTSTLSTHQHSQHSSALSALISTAV